MIPKISIVFSVLIILMFALGCKSSQPAAPGKKIDAADKERIEKDRQNFEQNMD